MKECSVEGCQGHPKGYGWCNKHYQRWKHYGDPLASRPRTTTFKPGQVPHNKGAPATPEFRAKVSESCKARFQRGRKLAGTFPPGNTPWNLGQTRPEATRQKIKEARAKQVITPEHRAAISRGNSGKPKTPDHVAKLAGPNHYRWKGGSARNLSRKEWRELRYAALERDNHCCQWCQRPGLTLIAHHILPYDQGGPDTLENLTSVCRSCHVRYHNLGNRRSLE
jgi:hypothetical protein